MTQHACNHLRTQHRKGSGRCLIPGCPCLAGPPPTTRATLAKSTRARAITTLDGSGTVVDYKPLQSDREQLENLLARRIAEAALPAPLRQYLWARPERMYRSDFAYISVPDGWRILIEVDGGIWMPGGGGHSHPMHLETQHHRDNLAALLGFNSCGLPKK